MSVTLTDATGAESTYYYAVTVQGDVAAILNTSGTAVVEYTYDAWGNPLTVTGTMAETLGETNSLRYCGYIYDQETGYYYLRSRYYNPELGRFISADGYASTGQGILGNNMFAYCNNDPVNNVDAYGKYPVDILEADDHYANRRPNSGEPGSTFVAPNGDWRKYGEDGKPELDYDHDDHGQPDKHPHDENGGHYHDWDWNLPKPRQESRASFGDALFGSALVIFCGVRVTVLVVDNLTGVGVVDDVYIDVLVAKIEEGVTLIWSWMGF